MIRNLEHRDDRARRPRGPRSSNKLCARSGTLDARKPMTERVMDSMRSSASMASRSSPRTQRSMARFRINMVDTPGHADFGGESRAHAVDGRLRPVARRRRQRPDAVDPFRHPEGIHTRPRADHRRRQDRPSRGAPGRGSEPDFRSLRPPRCERTTARFPDRL